MAASRPVAADCLRLKPQEIPLDHENSRFTFQRPFVATRGAMTTFGPETLFALLLKLQDRARQHAGLDYLQVFENLEQGGTDLWFIEDAVAVTALLPSEY